MYKKGTGNGKREKDAGNRTLCPYRNFSQVITKSTSQPSAVLFSLNLLAHLGVPLLVARLLKRLKARSMVAVPPEELTTLL